MGISNIVENLIKRGFNDVLSKDVWKVYAEYSDIEDNGLLIPADQIVSYSDQLTYRLTKCSRCVEAGKCIGYDTKGCSCNMPAKALVPCAECSEGRWGKMLSAEDWNKYKEERNISIEAVEP